MSHYISNFLGFSCSTIGTIFKERKKKKKKEEKEEKKKEEEEEKEEKKRQQQCSQQQSLKSALYVLEQCRRKKAQDST